MYLGLNYCRSGIPVDYMPVRNASVVNHSSTYLNLPYTGSSNADWHAVVTKFRDFEYSPRRFQQQYGMVARLMATIYRCSSGSSTHMSTTQASAQRSVPPHGHF